MLCSSPPSCLIIPSQSRLAAGSIPAHFYTLNHLNQLASRAHSLESLGYLFSTPLSHTPLSYYIHHSWDCFHIRSESSLSVSLVTLILSQLPFYLLLISLTLSLSNLADLIIPCLFSLLHSSHLSLDHPVPASLISQPIADVYCHQTVHRSSFRQLERSVVVGCFGIPSDRCRMVQSDGCLLIVKSGVSG